MGSDHVQTVWPNARVTLKNLDTKNESANVSDRLGTYTFNGVAYGHYEITVTLAGFEPVTRQFTIDANSPSKIDFQLSPKGQTESVLVRARGLRREPDFQLRWRPRLEPEPPQISGPAQSGLSGCVCLCCPAWCAASTDSFASREAGQTRQTRWSISASVTDPFTGQACPSLPSVAIHSVQVSRESLLVGVRPFLSGVVDLSTRGGTDDWKCSSRILSPAFAGSIIATLTASRALRRISLLRAHSSTGKLDLSVSRLRIRHRHRAVAYPIPDNVRIVEKSIVLATRLEPSASHRFTAVLRSILRTPTTPTSIPSIPSPSPPTII